MHSKVSLIFMATVAAVLVCGLMHTKPTEAQKDLFKYDYSMCSHVGSSGCESCCRDNSSYFPDDKKTKANGSCVCKITWKAFYNTYDH